MVMHHPSSAPSTRPPSSAAAHLLSSEADKSDEVEAIKRPSSASKGAVASKEKGKNFSPWGYHAGCHGAPVIMGRPGSGLKSSGEKQQRSYGLDRKRMLLPSPAAFGFVSPKPQSRSQTSMSCYSEQLAQPWFTGSRSNTPDLQQPRRPQKSRQKSPSFRRSSLPIRSQAGSPLPSSSSSASGQTATTANPGQRSRNSSGSAGGASQPRRPPLMSSTSFSGRLPLNSNSRNFEINLSGLMVTSMKLCERPKSSSFKKRPRSTNENHEFRSSHEDQAASAAAVLHRRKSSAFNAKSSNPGSRRSSVEHIPPIFNSVTDEENEAFLNQATEIDEKFFLNESAAAASRPQPKVEIFVKRFNHAEELEDIEGSDDNEDKET